MGTRAGGGTGLSSRDLIMKTFIILLNDDSGAAAAEYALILAIVGTGIAAAAWGLGDAIKTSMKTATTCISTPATSATAATGC